MQPPPPSRLTPPRRTAFLLSLITVVGLLGLWLWPVPPALAELPARDFNSRNLARLSATTHNPLIFAVFGDSRDHGGLFPVLLEELASEEDLDFAVHLGDMVNRGRLWEYQAFFRDLRALNGLPLLTVIGNHELKGEGLPLFRQIFGPTDLSFRLGDYAFVLINNAGKEGVSDTRLQWLRQELRRHQGARLRLVFLHKPLFDPRPRHSHAMPEAPARRLLAVLKEGRADHVFAGHIHGYFTGTWEGLPYTISGGAGTALHGRDPRHYFHHYLKVSATAGRLRVEVKPVDLPALPESYAP